MRSSARWRAGAGRLGVVAMGAMAAMALGCNNGPYKPPALHQFTTTYDFTIQPDSAPPHARDDVHYSITVLDRKTRQPIENGEGQIFAAKPIDPDVPNGPRSHTYDAMSYGPEVGVYHSKLNFVVPGTWAVAIRFRSDSLHPLERTDWMQDVLNERPSAIP